MTLESFAARYPIVPEPTIGTSSVSSVTQKSGEGETVKERNKAGVKFVKDRYKRMLVKHNSAILDLKVKEAAVINAYTQVQLRAKISHGAAQAFIKLVEKKENQTDSGQALIAFRLAGREQDEVNRRYEKAFGDLERLQRRINALYALVCNAESGFNNISEEEAEKWHEMRSNQEIFRDSLRSSKRAGPD